mmetsp:Transcript_27397/g.72118  ORF Transcript_27397/g.72118 Transcript_27397/m.72118 type:complete len:83 (+) Transcript_27397:1380-1628(+)
MQSHDTMQSPDIDENTQVGLGVGDGVGVGAEVGEKVGDGVGAGVGDGVKILGHCIFVIPASKIVLGYFASFDNLRVKELVES